MPNFRNAVANAVSIVQALTAKTAETVDEMHRMILPTILLRASHADPSPCPSFYIIMEGASTVD